RSEREDVAEVGGPVLLDNLDHRREVAKSTEQVQSRAVPTPDPRTQRRKYERRCPGGDSVPGPSPYAQSFVTGSAARDTTVCEVDGKTTRHANTDSFADPSRTLVGSERGWPEPSTIEGEASRAIKARLF